MARHNDMHATHAKHARTVLPHNWSNTLREDDDGHGAYKPVPGTQLPIPIILFGFLIGLVGVVAIPFGLPIAALWLVSKLVTGN